MLEKLLGLLSIGSSFASLSILHRFLSQLAIVLALILVSSLMAGALIIGAFYGLYTALVYDGLTRLMAASVVSALALGITLLFISLTVREVRKLRRLPSSSSGIHSKFPSLSSLSGIAEAFVDGLLGRPDLRRE
jgi:hypothetical protein